MLSPDYSKTEQRNVDCLCLTIEKKRTCVLAESQKEALVGADAVDEIDVKSVDVKFGRSNVESVGDELKLKLINRLGCFIDQFLSWANVLQVDP